MNVKVSVRLTEGESIIDTAISIENVSYVWSINEAIETARKLKNVIENRPKEEKKK